jgi:hypothetical protein
MLHTSCWCGMSTKHAADEQLIANPTGMWPGCPQHETTSAPQTDMADGFAAACLAEPAALAHNLTMHKKAHSKSNQTINIDVTCCHNRASMVPLHVQHLKLVGDTPIVTHCYTKHLQYIQPNPSTSRPPVVPLHVQHLRLLQSFTPQLLTQTIPVHSTKAYQQLNI